MSLTLQCIFAHLFIGATMALAGLWQDGDSIIIYSKPETNSTPSTVQKLRKQDATENECGHIQINLQETKIVGGREAERGEFPWIVALMRPNKINELTLSCGGSLIDDLHVLTAAHCVKNLSPSDAAKLIIRIGDHDIYSTTDGPHEVRKAACIIYHIGYSANTLNHDIALIRLSEPVKAAKYIQFVCLHPGKPSYDNMNADVAGWGALEDDDGEAPLPSKLRTVSVTIKSHETCKRKYSNSKSSVTFTEGMVCAGDEGEDACFGDSGGPLTINSRTKAQQVGIVSWGIACGSTPGVYTRVDKYITWINRNRMYAPFAE